MFVEIREERVKQLSKSEIFIKPLSTLAFGMLCKVRENEKENVNGDVFINTMRDLDPRVRIENAPTLAFRVGRYVTGGFAKKAFVASLHSGQLGFTIGFKVRHRPPHSREGPYLQGVSGGGARARIVRC